MIAMLQTPRSIRELPLRPEVAEAVLILQLAVTPDRVLAVIPTVQVTAPIRRGRNLAPAPGTQTELLAARQTRELVLILQLAPTPEAGRRQPIRVLQEVAFPIHR